MTAQGLTGDQISALEMLAGSPKGCSEAEMKAKGFTFRRRCEARIVEVAGRSVGMVRLAITEKGRAMIVR
jgi:hypothetical protein